MKVKTFTNRIDKFNKELSEAIETIGENHFYELNTTIIGDASTIEPFTYKILKGRIKVTDPNSGDVNECETADGEMEEGWDMDNVLDGIKYYKRMIKKTLRVWYSENPDEELEKEDRDEE